MIYDAQELMPASVLWLALQLASAGIFVAAQPDLTFFDAFYHCIITATTVGYGDVSVSTQAARLCASMHILVSVSWLAALFSQIHQSIEKRALQLERASLLTKPLQREMLVGLDKDGKGIDVLEFVIGMLQLLGVELCGERLSWDDVRPFMKKFDELDITKTGRITKSDLDTFYEQHQLEREQKLKALDWSESTMQMVHTAGTRLDAMRRRKEAKPQPPSQSHDEAARFGARVRPAP